MASVTKHVKEYEHLLRVVWQWRDGMEEYPFMTRGWTWTRRGVIRDKIIHQWKDLEWKVLSQPLAFSSARERRTERGSTRVQPKTATPQKV